MKTYFISFAGDAGNLGCCIVDASDQAGAIAESIRMKIHPGGEALLFEMPSTPVAMAEIENLGRNRLISPAELSGAGYQKLSDLDDEQRDFIDNYPGVSRVCERHAP